MPLNPRRDKIQRNLLGHTTTSILKNVQGLIQSLECRKISTQSGSSLPQKIALNIQ